MKKMIIGILLLQLKKLAMMILDMLSEKLSGQEKMSMICTEMTLVELT